MPTAVSPARSSFRDLLLRTRPLAGLTTAVVSLGAAHANTLVVTTLNDVSNATDGLCSLREAAASLDGASADPTCSRGAATASDLIRLRVGTYCLTAPLSIPADVTIRGAGATSTYLDAGNGATSTCATASGDRVISVASGAVVAIESVGIRGGYSEIGGAGVYADASTDLTLTSVTVSDNEVAGGLGSVGGGGVYLGAYGVLDVQGATISGNVVDCPAADSSSCAHGGGIATGEGVDVTIEDSLVGSNSVTAQADSARGGGVSLGSSTSYPSSISVATSTIADNAAYGEGSAGALGGGIDTEYCGEVRLDEVVLDGNVSDARAVRAFGAGLTASFCDAVLIEDSTVSRNRTLVAAADLGAYGGGMYLGSVTNTSVTRSTFSDNEAVHVGTSAVGAAYGGGLYLHGETASLVNTTLSGNRADADGDAYGGGLFTKGNVVVYMVHSTVADNEADGGTAAYGGGLSHFPSSSSRNEQVLLLNSVVAGNTSVGGTSPKGPDCYSKTYTLGNNVVSDDTNCLFDSSLATGLVTDYLDVDPQLGNLANNGGRVETQALPSSSPARGVASCLDWTGAAVASDARGIRRDSRCDPGAYEYSDRRSPPSSTTRFGSMFGAAAGHVGDAFDPSSAPTDEGEALPGSRCATVSAPMGAWMLALGIVAAGTRRRPTRP